VYLHFSSGEELTAAVVEDLFADLRRELDAADDSQADPATRLHAAGQTLALWAQRRPGAYQVLFEAPDVVPPGSGPGLDLLDRVAGLLAALGHRPHHRCELLAMRIWAGLHGVISLRLHKPNAPWPASIDADIDDVLAVLMKHRSS
jgi:AcrR family transcriptional regulator